MTVAAPSGKRPSGKGVAAAAIGNALEFYDFMIYTFFVIQIGHAFFPADTKFASLMLSLATFGAGFVTRPIGGIVIGLYADRAGRRAAMTLCYVMMGVSVLLMAVTPTYESIGIAAPLIVLLTRLLQGFSAGGAIGPNAAFLLESAKKENRGFAVSLQAATQFLAAMMGSLIGLCLSLILSPEALNDYGWRIAFAIGALALPVGIWMQHTLPETLDRPDDGVSASEPEASRMDNVRQHKRIIALGFMVKSCGPIVTYVFHYFATYAQNSLGISTAKSFTISTIGNLGSAAAILAGGWLSDRLGRRPIVIWSNLFHILLAYPVALWMVQSRSDLSLLSYIIVGSIGMMPFGVFAASFSECLPKNIRSSGYSTIYAVTVLIFGSTCQPIVAWMEHVTGDPLSSTWYLMGAMLVAQLAFLMFPESAPARRPLFSPRQKQVRAA